MSKLHLPCWRQSTGPGTIVMEASCVVELGVWQGAWIGRCFQHSPGDYTLYAVDSWPEQGSGMSVSAGPAAAAKAQFEKNCRTWITSGRIKVMHMSTLDAALYFLKAKAGEVDILHIDASHARADVLADMRAWIPLVRHCGLIIGHDYSGHRQSRDVQGAVGDYFELEPPIDVGGVLKNERVQSFFFRKETRYGEQAQGARRF
jgi:hypothetical protein